MTLIPQQESLTCEFKSDRQCLSDRDLIEAVVCMANAQGGEIYLGVEDNGTVTGLHPNHLHFDGLAALIANRTQPALTNERDFPVPRLRRSFRKRQQEP